MEAMMAYLSTSRSIKVITKTNKKYIIIQVSKSDWFLHLLRHTIGLKKTRATFSSNQNQLSRSHSFSRASRQLRVLIG